MSDSLYLTDKDHWGDSNTLYSLCDFEAQAGFVPCMLCALYRGSQPAPARKHEGSWRRSCLEQTAWALLGRLQPQCHFLCAFSSGAKEAEGRRAISCAANLILWLYTSEEEVNNSATRESSK